MKPIYLEFYGVNSFSDRTIVDFKKLLSGGVFGIFGATGSGKSTILDCIHLALYGKVGRSSEVECINYNCDGYEIIYEFEIQIGHERKTYRVLRGRKKKNNTTTSSLYERREDGKLYSVAEGTRDVTQKLLEIIGLTYEDFKMCIALPQGDFAELVHAGAATRVELVSRLFDLERYGKRLTRKISERRYAAETEETVLKTRLEGLGECGTQAIENAREELSKKRLDFEKVSKALEKAQSVFENMQKAYEKKTEYENLQKQLDSAKSSLPIFEQKRAKIERYPSAKSVAEKARTVQETKSRLAAAESAVRSAKIAYEDAQKALECAENELKKQDFETLLTAIEVQIAQANLLEQDKKALQKAQTDLEDCRKRYKELQSKTLEEDFDGKIKAIELEEEKLGKDGTLIEYLRTRFKDVMLVEEYAKVREDLRGLGEKYPIVLADVTRLIEKYTPVTSGDEKSFDIAEAKLKFDEIERAKKRLSQERLAIEKRRLLYEQNISQLELIKQEGDLLRQAAERAKEKLGASAVEDVGVLERKKQALKAAKDRAESSLSLSRERASKTQAEHLAKQAVVATTKETLVSAEEQLKTALQENGFLSVDDAQNILLSVGDFARAKAETDDFFIRYNACAERLKNFDTGAFDGYVAESHEKAAQERKEQEEQKTRLIEELGALTKTLTDLEKNAEVAAEIEKQLKVKADERATLERLSKLTHGNAFMNFIASEYLQDISARASTTLRSLTGGRYFLSYEDKEFFVGDNLNGGEKRTVRTLSGGETFLVSLSLALSLSAEICQSVRHIEFFFLDEGFGTLDGKLVDIVMDVLGKLSKDFSIGLISHVEELKHRIHHKIIVDGATESRGSTVTIETH